MKQGHLSKSEIVQQLWQLWQAGDSGIDAYDVNQFEMTGWLKKSLVEKLGLPIKTILKDEETSLKKDEIFKEEDNYLSKDDVLDLMLQMFKSGEESQLINRHTITQYEMTGQVNEDALKVVFKKAGRNYYELKKKDKFKEGVRQAERTMRNIRTAALQGGKQMLEGKHQALRQDIEQTPGIKIQKPKLKKDITINEHQKLTEPVEEKLKDVKENLKELEEAHEKEERIEEEKMSKKLKKALSDLLSGGKQKKVNTYLKQYKQTFAQGKGHEMSDHIATLVSNIKEEDKPKKEEIHKEKGDSDFLEDKKKHRHQRRGPLKSLLNIDINKKKIKKFDIQLRDALNKFMGGNPGIQGNPARMFKQKKKKGSYPKELASENIAAYMKHKEKHPGDAEQAIAIGINQARHGEKETKKHMGGIGLTMSEKGKEFFTKISNCTECGYMKKKK